MFPEFLVAALCVVVRPCGEPVIARCGRALKSQAIVRSMDPRSQASWKKLPAPRRASRA